MSDCCFIPSSPKRTRRQRNPGVVVCSGLIRRNGDGGSASAVRGHRYLEEGREGVCPDPGARPDPHGGDVTTWGAMSHQILALRDHLLDAKVTCVVIEATSYYGKPFDYLLEDKLDVILVNARAVKNMPGRKSDVSDAAWLADLGAHGLVRASLVPPPPIRQLRDLTRPPTSSPANVAGRRSGWRSSSKTP